MGILSIFVFICSISQLPDFYRENINITVNDSTAEVEGYYYLFNNSVDDIKITLAYPFPLNGGLEFPFVISVFNNTARDNIAYKKRKNSISFPVFISALDSTIILINYTQKCTNRYFEYIVTSTKLWGKPLELAEFTIEIDSNLKLSSHSYGFDSTYKEKDKTYYYFKKENFFPDENIYLRWERRQNEVY
jgi:hypothetical protein